MTAGADQRPSQPWWLGLRKLAGRARRRFGIDTYDVFRRSVPEAGDFEVPEGYRFAWGTSQDILRCDERETELDAGERRLGTLRLESGHRIAIGFHGDRPVFTMWTNPRHLNVPGLMKRKLGAHQWFIYKAFTSPDHRGRKLYETGMRFVLAEMGAEGKSELIGYAHVKKKISRRGLSALAFDRVGIVRQFKAPGFVWTRVSRELARYFPEATPRSGLLDGGEAVSDGNETTIP